MGKSWVRIIEPRELCALGALALSMGSCAEPGSPPPAGPAQVPSAAPTAATPAAKAERPRVIVFVWDGLRPDSIDANTTPNLARLRDGGGVNFTDHHSAYPTFTMMNAAALATGGYAAAHGFYGNTEYQPGPVGRAAAGWELDFSQPIFTEDYGVLRALEVFYRPRGEHLLGSETLFEAAQKAKLKTAVVGKTGPAFLMDYREGGLILDENIAVPRDFAESLQRAGLPLPLRTTNYPYPFGGPKLASNNGDPTAETEAKVVWMADHGASDPRATSGSPHNGRNEYLMRAYLRVILAEFAPDLSVVWLRNPDTTEHHFGPGTPNHRDALVHQDTLLGELLAKLDELGLRAKTDLLVVSDHGHSTVAGSAKLFPLRGLSGPADGSGQLGKVQADGYSVSGGIRSADLLTRAGLAHVYDGSDCIFSPALSGVRADGKPVYPTNNATGNACGRAGVHYSTGDFRVPKPNLPPDTIVIAANGGSEYFYVLDHAPARLASVVSALQEHSVYGAIFVHSRYGSVPGTLPLTSIHAEGPRAAPPTPDLIVSFDFDETAIVAGAPGTEYASMQQLRGMHGSFSPIDVHNTLIASGPHFKTSFADPYPTGNVDVAPTIAAILEIPFNAPHGRVLEEALRGKEPALTVATRVEPSSAVSVRRVCAADDPACARPSGPATYRFTLQKKVLTLPGGKTHEYFDRAKAARD
jgi:arylsulfatase A-like enzyme